MSELENFLDELKTKSEIQSVILFGSHARGNARPNSDIDLIIICNETRRGVEERNGKFFELVYVTEEDAKTFYLDNKDNAVRTWKIAKILFDRDGAAERLKQFVLAIEEKGKVELSEEKLAHSKFDIEDALRGMETNIMTDPVSVSYLMGIKLLSLLELFFDIRGLWKPAPKQLLQEIQKKNSDLYALIADFYLAKEPGKKLSILKSITELVFSP